MSIADEPYVAPNGVTYVGRILERRDAPMAHHRAGLQWTRSGYGRKIPTPYLVRLADRRWRRVYVVCFGNSGSAYVLVRGKAQYLPTGSLYAIEARIESDRAV